MKATFCWILSKWPGQLPCHLFFVGLSNPFKTRCKFEYYKEEMFCLYYSLASTCNSKHCRSFINVFRRRATRSKNFFATTCRWSNQLGKIVLNGQFVGSPALTESTAKAP